MQSSNRAHFLLGPGGEGQDVGGPVTADVIAIDAARRCFGVGDFDPMLDAADWLGLPNTRLLPARQRLIAGGDPFRSLYFLCSGALKMSACAPDGEVQIVAFHMPGALLGFDGLSANRYVCDVDALMPSTVRALSVERLLLLARSMPEVLVDLLRLVSREATAFHKHAALLGRRNAMARLAAFLNGMSNGLARPLRDPDDLCLPMSRAELANYLGLAVETLSRLLSRLHRTGVVSVKRENVRLLDRRALNRLSAGTRT